MNAESQLSLQQVIDDKISTSDVNNILKSLDDAPEDDFIQRLNDLGIIENLIKKCRSASSEKFPAHVTEKKSSLLKFVDHETDRIVESDIGLVPEVTELQKSIFFTKNFFRRKAIFVRKTL